MINLTLRELQLAELNILTAFDSFCRQHGLKYSLVGGTLLGAIRHKGFIPWDDDVDVGMPRPDYEKFFSMLKENNFVLPTQDSLVLIPDRGEDAKLPYLKLTDTNIYINSKGGQVTKNIWIDIFPADGFPADDKQAWKLFKKLRGYRRIMFYSINNGSTKRSWRKVAAKFYRVYAKCYGIKRALKNMQKAVANYSYDTSEYIGCLVWGMYGVGERLNRDSYSNLIDVEFESHQFCAIKNYDEYLTGIYGDYMTPPPENKRGSHYIIAYKKSETDEDTNE